MEELKTICGVAFGGALGAVVRFAVSAAVTERLVGGFPYGTFVINITGAFLAGCLVVMVSERALVSDLLKTSLMVGFLGAYTTFSAFEMENLNLLRAGNYVTAISYTVFSVIGGLAAVYLGSELGRRL